MQGDLYIVATPIGNLGDLGKRAINTLKQVDLIAAEDTRRSRILLEHFAIDTPVRIYHEHNELQLTPQLIRILINGQSIALISDAGTPLINDPGYKLVAAAHDQGLRVVPIPGPSAIIAALSASGLPSSRFIFEGYAPVKSEARKKHLQTCLFENRTLVFHEAPHRVAGLLADIQEIFGPERRITIARELTKQFEQIERGTIATINTKLLSGEIAIKGEFVVIIEGSAHRSKDDKEALRINMILAKKSPPKEAVALTAEITGRKKNEIYRLVISNRNKLE